MVETLLEVRNLSKTFRYRTGWFHRQTVEAVKPLSFTLRERQTGDYRRERFRQVNAGENARRNGRTQHRRTAD